MDWGGGHSGTSDCGKRDRVRAARPRRGGGGNVDPPQSNATRPQGPVGGQNALFRRERRPVREEQCCRVAGAS